MAARKRHPHHSLAIDVAAAHAEAGHGHGEHFSQRRLRWIRAWHQTDHRARRAERSAPDRSVGGVRHHSVERRVHAHVPGGIHRLARLGIGVALAVAVGVEHQRRPALRFRGVSAAVELLRVQPADDGAAAAGPQRVIGVVAELQVVRGEAGVDERVLLRPGIEHRDVAHGAVHREGLRRRVIRAGLAERGVVGAAHRRREPQPAVAPEHRVVVVDARLPDALAGPVG